jgi:hypothetical protein
MPRGIVVIIVYKAVRQTWRIVLITRIASRAGHPARAAFTRERAVPRPLGMGFADPAAILAKLAYHANRSAPAGVNIT